MNSLWQRYVTAVLNGDSQTVAGTKTGVSQPTIGRWLGDQVKATDAGNVAAFAHGYGRNVLEAFVAAGLLDESDATQGLSDLDRAFLKRLRRGTRVKVQSTKAAKVTPKRSGAPDPSHR